MPEVEPTCAETGVLGPVVGTLGTLQAVEVLGVLLGWPDRLVGRLTRLNAKTMEWKSSVTERIPIAKCVDHLRALSSKFDSQPEGLPFPVTFITCPTKNPSILLFLSSGAAW